MEDRDMIFKGKNDLYVAEWKETAHLNATVAQNELLFSKEQVCRVRVVYEFLFTSGFLSLVEAYNLVTYQAYLC